MRQSLLMSAGLMVWLGVSTAAGQDISVEKNKLLAKRAAEADAYRKLAEAVYGLQINSRTYVEDFVAESDSIRTDVDSFIKGIRLGTPTWYDDGSCEIPAEVTVAKVIETLKTAHSRHYDGDDIDSEDFQSITKRTEKQVIKVIGMGAPREDLPPDLPVGAAEQLPPAPGGDGPRPAIPEIWRQAGPQARLMAVRAARVDAIRKLAERLKGLRLTSRTQVQDFVAESDVIRTELSTQMQTVGQETDVYLHHNELIAEVTLSIPTTQVITTIKRLHSRYYEGDDIEGHDIEEVVKRVVKKDFAATGMGVPPEKYLRRYQQRAQVTLPDWSMEQITATGMGTDPDYDTPQGRLRAARAAEVDAKRKLVERIHGLRVRSETSVRDFATEYDHVATLMDAFIVDAVVTDTEFGADSVAVTVALPGMRVWEVVHAELRRQQR